MPAWRGLLFVHVVDLFLAVSFSCQINHALSVQDRQRELIKSQDDLAGLSILKLGFDLVHPRHLQKKKEFVFSVTIVEFKLFTVELQIFLMRVWSTANF